MLFECGGCCGDEISGGCYACDSVGVFFLVKTSVGDVGARRVCVDCVVYLVVRPAAVGGFVREEDGGASDAECGVEYDLGRVGAGVDAAGRVLGAHDQRASVFVHLFEKNDAIDGMGDMY